MNFVKKNKELHHDQIVDAVWHVDKEIVNEGTDFCLPNKRTIKTS